MIVDTSALVAILLREPDAPGLERLLGAADVRRMSAASYVELCAVIDGRRDQVGSAKVDRLIRKLEIEIVPFTDGRPGSPVPPTCSTGGAPDTRPA